jgi:hypothetical protein
LQRSGNVAAIAHHARTDAAPGGNAMRALMIGFVTLYVFACGREEPARSAHDQSTTTSAETSGRAAPGEGSLGPGISGSTEHGLTSSPDGTPYQGNVDPGSPSSNRNKRTEPNDVRTAPLAK